VKLLIPSEVSEILRCRLRSLYEPVYRQRIGLPAVRVGRKFLFKEVDVLRIIEQGTEKFPVRPVVAEGENVAD
jgi:hypothetical protein